METLKLIAEIIQTIAGLIVVGSVCWVTFDDYIKPKYKAWKNREETMMKRLS